MPRSTSPSRIRSDEPTDPGGGGGSIDGGDGGGGDGDGDRLVKVAFAPNQIEAEMIQGLLSSHGIPSLVKRAGFDVPEFMSVGPRQIFVAARMAEEAREVLTGIAGAD
ncbi:MAG: DUF2007 domain-containing protein [Solirubrobacterales bacterium]